MSGPIEYGDLELDWGWDGRNVSPTLSSCDRYWTVVTFEDDAPPEWPDLQHSMMFFEGEGALTYELTDEVLFWGSLPEARLARERMQGVLDERARARGFVSPTLYLINWGDHAREENRVVGLKGPWREPHAESVAAIEEWRRRRELYRQMVAGQPPTENEGEKELEA